MYMLQEHNRGVYSSTPRVEMVQNCAQRAVASSWTPFYYSSKLSLLVLMLHHLVSNLYIFQESLIVQISLPTQTM